MQLPASEVNYFLQKIARCTNHSPTMLAWANELVSELTSFAGLPHYRQVRLGLANSSDQEKLAKLIKLAFAWRYGGDGQQVAEKFAALSFQPHCQTLVAKLYAPHARQVLLLATCRLTRAHQLRDLELVTYYRFNDGNSWQRYLADKVAYELSHLAFHPLFELGRYRALQFKLTRELLHLCLGLASEPQAWVGLTARHNVAKFLTKASCQLAPIANLTLQPQVAKSTLATLLPRYLIDFYAYQLLSATKP